MQLHTYFRPNLGAKTVGRAAVALCFVGCVGIASVAGVIGCSGEIVDPTGGSGGDDDDDDTPPDGQGTAYAGPVTMWRLTDAQYRNSVADIFGSGLALAADALEVDEASERFRSIGASKVATSERGVSQYFEAGLTLAAQIVNRADRYPELQGCAARGPADPCIAAAIRSFGRRLWRRPLAAAEVDRYAAIVAQSGSDEAAVRAGLEYALAGLLASPNFIYVTWVGEPDDSGDQRLTSREMASRLSYFLWNSTPDSELLDIAESGQLAGADAIATQVNRMLNAPRGAGLVSRFREENWLVGDLDVSDKNTEKFPNWTQELVAAYRTEFDLFFRDLVDRDADVRAMFDARTTFMNRELAAIYGVEGPGDGFGPAELPPERSGILTSPALLAASAPSARTSPTFRGLFVVDRLLCERTPSPPPGVDTTIEDPDDGQAATFRELLEQHRADPQCAGCHENFDPAGFTFENFDAIGAFRTDENGLPIDSTGEFQGHSFENVGDLAAFLRDDPRVPRCLALRLYSFATGLSLPENYIGIEDIAAAFQSDRRFHQLITDIATSRAFRYLPSEEAP